MHGTAQGASVSIDIIGETILNDLSLLALVVVQVKEFFALETFQG